MTQIEIRDARHGGNESTVELAVSTAVFLSDVAKMTRNLRHLVPGRLRGPQGHFGPI
jgi:hypothetical protein